MRDVAILGIGQTPIGEHWDQSIREIAGGAVFAALRDAGREKVDGIFVGNILVDDNIARLEDGTLAGSIVSSDQVLRNLISITGCTLDQAVQTLTSTPAKLLGEKIGHIAPDYRSDLTLLDQELNVRATIIGGKVVWKRELIGLN